jgi:hypothetical protein
MQLAAHAYAADYAAAAYAYAAATDAATDADADADAATDADAAIVLGFPDGAYAAARSAFWSAVSGARGTRCDSLRHRRFAAVATRST